MSQCQCCGVETSNPKFCSRSCSAQITNRTAHKRRLKGACEICEKPISKSRKRCSECRHAKRNTAFVDSDLKTCSGCGEVKQLVEFAKSTTALDGRRNLCKPCHSQYMQSYYKNNPEKDNRKRELNTLPFRKVPNWQRHKLTENQFNVMLSKYNGLCWSCKKREATCIDHDHKHCSGTKGCPECVRGLLCHWCNSALGHVEDSVENLQSLIAYLQN